MELFVHEHSFVKRLFIDCIKDSLGQSSQNNGLLKNSSFYTNEANPLLGGSLYDICIVFNFDLLIIVFKILCKYSKNKTCANKVNKATVISWPRLQS